MGVFILIILMAAALTGGFMVVRKYRNQSKKSKYKHTELDKNLQELLSDSRYNRISKVEQESMDRMKKFLNERIELL